VPAPSKPAPGFDVIGPFQLSKTDLVVGVFVERFGHKARLINIFFLIVFVVAAVFFASGSSQFSWVSMAAILLAVVEIFVVRSLLVMLRYRGWACLSYDERGIDARSMHGYALYRWDMIKSIEKFGPRLLIHIVNGGALIVPERSTTTKNLEQILSTLQHHDVAMPMGLAPDVRIGTGSAISTPSGPTAQV